MNRMVLCSKIWSEEALQLGLLTLQMLPLRMPPPGLQAPARSPSHMGGPLGDALLTGPAELSLWVILAQKPDL